MFRMVISFKTKQRGDDKTSCVHIVPSTQPFAREIIKPPLFSNARTHHSGGRAFSIGVDGRIAPAVPTHAPNASEKSGSQEFRVSQPSAVIFSVRALIAALVFSFSKPRLFGPENVPCFR